MTLVELYRQVGAKLGIVRADETLSYEDADLIGRAYVALHDQLLTESMATWSVTDEVPDWVAPVIAEMVAAMLVDAFGLEEPRRTTIRAEGIFGNAPVSPAERRLRRQLALPYVPNNVQASYH